MLGGMMSDDGLTTWQALLDDARKDAKDESPVVSVAPNPDALEVRFDDGYGSPMGGHVLIWTEERVYFPVVYDGAEWLGSAPRNPATQDGQDHVGSW
jgi:hypothetical protein